MGHERITRKVVHRGLPKLPGRLRSSLQSFQANPEQSLASKGNELGIKGHDVLFARSSS